MQLTHLSLFSGIGGLDLAAEWAGFKTIGQCEWAEYPTKVLEKQWPDVPRWKDIRTLTRESFYERTNRRTVDVISGGFPCQPFSVAGKRRGKEDDRFLWPEMVRVIKELRPTWIIGENVAGIVRMALPDILSELDSEGYRARAFLIPACAVGARHRRYRVAIVGYAEYNGLPASAVAGSVTETGGGQQEREKTASKFTGAGQPRNCKDVADTKSRKNRGLQEKLFGWECNEADVCDATGKGLSDGTGEPVEGQGAPEPEPKRPDCNVSDTDNGSRTVWRNRKLSATEEIGGGEGHESREWRQFEPGLGGMVNGIPDWVDGYWDVEPDIPRIASGVPNRVGRLKALGNAVVPEQFYPFFKAIAEVEMIILKL